MYWGMKNESGHAHMARMPFRMDYLFDYRKKNRRDEKW